jgi:hypothetical protein
MDFGQDEDVKSLLKVNSDLRANVVANFVSVMHVLASGNTVTATSLDKHLIFLWQPSRGRCLCQISLVNRRSNCVTTQSCLL